MSVKPTLYFVAGARPNFVKIAAIYHAMNPVGLPFQPRLVHTGQHYDDVMSKVFFDELAIPEPNDYLGVGSGTHGAQTARVLAGFEELLLREPGNACGVVVVGDVNSTMACTLAAVKLAIRVAHVEAGLRSFDRSMPEEINRVVTDAIAHLLLVTEESARLNLMAEGARPETIVMVGNVMIDTLYRELPAARALRQWSNFSCEPGEYAFVTFHRPSNVDSRDALERLVRFLVAMAERVKIIFAVHPRTRERIETFGLRRLLGENDRLTLTEPLAYRETVSLLTAARFVLTDSGGLQEETSALGVPCLTFRDNTERPVTVDLGTNTIVGSDFVLAERLVGDILGNRYKIGRPIPMWDGQAATRVLQAIRRAWFPE